MEIYLIRHTTPKIDKGICYGHSDIELDLSFEDEHRKLKSALPNQFDIVFSSPLIRCYQLAQRISAKETKLDKRLQEMNFGNWEMRKWDEIDQAELSPWMQDFVNIRVPNGENFIDLNNRVNHFIDELPNNHEKIAVITHAGVIRCFVARILEIPLKNAFKIPCDYSSVTKINLDQENCYSNIEYLNKIVKP